MDQNNERIGELVKELQSIGDLDIRKTINPDEALRMRMMNADEVYQQTYHGSDESRRELMLIVSNLGAEGSHRFYDGLVRIELTKSAMVLK